MCFVIYTLPFLKRNLYQKFVFYIIKVLQFSEKCDIIYFGEFKVMRKEINMKNLMNSAREIMEILNELPMVRSCKLCGSLAAGRSDL